VLLEELVKGKEVVGVEALEVREPYGKGPLYTAIPL